MRFVKICVAYCQITIPNLTNLQITLKLQLMTAQIALINNLISECDSIIRNMIIDIQKDLKANLINLQITLKLQLKRFKRKFE